MDLAFDLNTYDERQQRTMKRMRALGLEALIVNMPDNLNYLVGFDSIGYLWYQALVLSPALKAPTFFTRTTEEPCTWETSAVREGRFFDIARQDPVEMVADLLKEAGVGNRTIGVEMAAFTMLPVQWERLKALLPEATFHDASTLVAEERLIKSPREIAYQRAAAAMADHAMLKGLAALRPGISEVAVAGLISAALGEVGSEYAAIPPMVTSGPRSAMIHAMASNRTLQLGDVVIIELAGVSRRYHAVFMRTAVIGRPTARLTEIAGNLREATEAAIAALKPGAKAGAPNHACNAVTDRIGITKNRAHRIGYSLGLAYPPTWLEAMILDDPDPHTISPEMSFTIEPNMSFHAEGFGYKIGETALCTPEGGRSLSRLDHQLSVID